MLILAVQWKNASLDLVVVLQVLFLALHREYQPFADRAVTLLAVSLAGLILSSGDICQGRRNYEPIENWPPWENELQRTKFHTCRSTNADQIAPGSGDPIAD